MLSKVSVDEVIIYELFSKQAQTPNGAPPIYPAGGLPSPRPSNLPTRGKIHAGAHEQYVIQTPDFR